MPASPDDLFRLLADWAIETRTYRHKALHSVEESIAYWEAAGGKPAGGHCKNLFLKDKKAKLWLVVTLEERALPLQALAKAIGAARVSFGRADLLMEILGVTPGSVTPFALINDGGARVQVVLDEDMLRHDPLHYHPLDNAMTTAIASRDLLAFVRRTGHEPLIVDMAPLADAAPG